MPNQRGVIPLTLLIAIIGVVLLLGVASLLPINSNLREFFLKPFSFANTITNLLSNGDFEADFTSWPVNTSYWSIDPTGPYQGVKSAHYKGDKFGGVRRNITLPAGKTYKISYWLKLNTSTCTGDCWGWTGVSIANFANISQFGNAMITPSNTPIGVWKKYSFEVTVNGPQTTGQLDVGPFSGAGWNWDFQIDDLKIFEKPTSPIPPFISSITADKTTITTISDAISFNSTSDDDDGSINYYFWDFGDGGKSNLPSPQYRYTSNGNYTAKLMVFDDSGQSAEAQLAITVNDPTLSRLTINTSSQTITNSNISLSGSSQAGSGKTITKVEYSTDRGILGTASSTSNWNANLDLSPYPGLNKILVSAYDNQGGITSKTVDITYNPTNKISIQNGANGITSSSSTIELYDKFEATFNIQNGVFTKPYLPYETNLPLGMNRIEKQGVTVEATFTSPSGKTFKQPGFLYQPYQRVISTKQLLPQGNPVWKIRFSPTELGTWTYTIMVTDASGSSSVSGANLTFNTISQTNPNNHGFLKPSPKDKRYFEFSDGTPFIGVGPSTYISSDSSFDTDVELAKYASNSANLTRTWMSGGNISGSSWAPWSANIGNVSNSPGTSLTTEQVYGNGIYSLTLPQQGPGANTNSVGSRCVFIGWDAMHGKILSVKPNTNYRILIRLKTDNITGTGGFTFRPNDTAFGGVCDTHAAKPLTVPYQKGTTDWHVVTANWNSGGLTRLTGGLLTLENVTGGRVYIDELSLQEDLGNNSFGPEVLPRSKFNVQDYFSQPQSWNWDYGLDEFSKRGLYQKPVIEEKDDYSYNYISPYGFGYDKGGQMNREGSVKYQEYFWRYLIARWGYSRAIHSFEYANEQAPGALSGGQRLAKYLKDNDPNKHMGNTSNWAGLNGGWENPAYQDISNADAHSYAHTDASGTSWLKGATFPLTIGGITIPSSASLVTDSALYTYAHSVDQYLRNAAFNKPMIIGEAGLTNGSITLGNNDSDTQGVWWHQFVWAQINHGGAYIIYWYDNTIKSNNLSTLVVPYRQFMEGKASDSVNTRVPLNNGNYTNIQLTLPSGINGWGQKDMVNGGAHFWLYDQAFTWTTPTGGTNVNGKIVSFDGLPAKQYTVEFWDTWNGNTTKQTLNHGGGIMNLTIPNQIAQKDVAVKIYPTNGYLSTQITPTPLPSGNTKVGDIDGNNKVDIFDYNQILTDFGKKNDPVTKADLDDDNDVDIFDYNIVLTNFGR